MRIVADENIPFALQAFGSYGEVKLLPGRTITRSDVLDADALVVRSVTRVAEELLDGTPVRFIGTATIGTDHVDVGYLRRSGIAFADAAGSNSRSVAEYVVAALLELRRRGSLSIAGNSIGVMGVGRIGTLVSGLAASLGMRVVGYDPPRAERDGFPSAPLDALLDCDVITLHLPLTRNVPHPTYHLLDDSVLSRLRPNAVVINTSRGGAVDTNALVDARRKGWVSDVVLDVWEEEPSIPTELAERCTLITPHIAGYSFDGKVAGTRMMADALARFAGSESNWSGTELLEQRGETIVLGKDPDPLDAIDRAVTASYDITVDDRNVRRLLERSAEERGAGFDRLRKEYRVRREWRAYGVDGGSPTARSLARELGFTVEFEHV